MYYYRGKKFTYKLHTEDIDEASFVVHRTSPRSYAIFNNVDAFVGWYLNVPVSERHFDEVIIGAQKFRLDIDGPSSLDVEWYAMIDLICCSISTFFGKLEPKICVYDSSSMNKMSTHIIVGNYMFPSHIDCYNIAYHIKKRLPDYCSQYIDMGIYKKTQNLRLEGSTKTSCIRYKKALYGSESFYDGLITCPLGTSEAVVECVIPVSYHIGISS